MAKLLTTKGIAYFLDELFKSSREYVYIVSPYFKIDQQLGERIFEAADNGLKVILIYGKDRQQINQIYYNSRNKIEILFYEDLHAKFYMNEKHVLITSMNMHSYSQANNREVGVLFSRKDKNDLQVIEDCFKEFESIRKQSEKMSSPVNKGTGQAVKPEYESVHSILSEQTNNSNSMPKKISNIIKETETTGENMSEYQSRWHNYLIETFPKTQFEVNINALTAKNFPMNGVDFSTEFGFATFYVPMKIGSLRNEEFRNVQIKFSNYKLYWKENGRIMIYRGNIKTLTTIQTEHEYCAEGIEMMKSELKRLWNKYEY